MLDYKVVGDNFTEEERKLIDAFLMVDEPTGGEFRLGNFQVRVYSTGAVVMVGYYCSFCQAHPNFPHRPNCKAVLGGDV